MNYVLKLGKIYKITDDNFEENLGYIPETRRDYILKMSDQKRQKQSLIATLLLEECLKDLGRLEDYSKLVEGKDGQWVLEGSDVYFSFSHSGDIVMAVASLFPIGCDVELIKETKIEVAERFFLPSEVENIKSSSHPDMAFLSCWTIKESYLKLIGKGLHSPLNVIEVDESLTAIKNHPEFVVESCFLNDYVLSVVYKK